MTPRPIPPFRRPSGASLPRRSLALRTAVLAGVALAGPIAGPLGAQNNNSAQQKSDILTPFRNPTQDYAPPDAVYEALRTMQAVAEGPARDSVRTDQDGREVCDHPEWKAAFQRLEAAKGPSYENYLAQIMRRSRSVEDRATAFYGAFFGDHPEHVINLISHIPGEPFRPTREKALARAIPYLRVHLTRRFGDLSETEQAELMAGRPQVGSPAAKSMGITSDPTAESFLYALNLKPFAELLLVEDPLDRAQGWWFFKELVQLRRGDVDSWMRPMVLRMRRAAVSDNKVERNEVFGLLAAIDPQRRSPPPIDAEGDALTDWINDVIESVFPPIRTVSEGLVEIYPGRQREELIAVGRDVLRRGGLGEFKADRFENGDWYRGIQINALLPPLEKLGLPVGAVLCSLNGQPITGEKQLLDAVTKQLTAGAVSLIVEYARGGEMRAVEFRVLR